METFITSLCFLVKVLTQIESSKLDHIQWNERYLELKIYTKTISRIDKRLQLKHKENYSK